MSNKYITVTKVYNSGQGQIQQYRMNDKLCNKKTATEPKFTQITVQSNSRDELQWIRGNLNFSANSLYKFM
jgi:hypothetical protein